MWELSVLYLVSLGIYFKINSNYQNYYLINNQQHCAPPHRQRKKQQAIRNNSASKQCSNIDKLQEEKRNEKTLKAVNAKRGSKLEMEKNSKGLDNNTNVGKEVATIDNPMQHLSKRQRKRLRDRLRKEANLAAQKSAVVQENHKNGTGSPENCKQKQELQTVNAANTLKPVDQIKQNKAKFSVRDPRTPEILNSIARCFSNEIKQMQLRLKETKAQNTNNDEQDMIIAKISMNNNEIITKHVFEFLRTDLVGWIGAYQREGLNTPIFHDIENKNTYINVICENHDAFNCLEQCVNEISEIKSIGVLRLSRLPSITPVIHCFDFIYQGLARDAEVFLKQLHLHKPKLLTDNWQVVSHDFCTHHNLTYFIFFVDERSALALNFQYSSSFCVCLQTVKIHYRGIVAEKVLN